MNDLLIILAFMVGLAVASPAEFTEPAALVGTCIFCGGWRDLDSVDMGR